jgi:hypothetical protein
MARADECIAIGGLAPEASVPSTVSASEALLNVQRRSITGCLNFFVGSLLTFNSQCSANSCLADGGLGKPIASPHRTPRRSGT